MLDKYRDKVDRQYVGKNYKDGRLHGFKYRRHEQPYFLHYRASMLVNNGDKIGIAIGDDI